MRAAAGEPRGGESPMRRLCQPPFSHPPRRLGKQCRIQTRQNENLNDRKRDINPQKHLLLRIDVGTASARSSFWTKGVPVFVSLRERIEGGNPHDKGRKASGTHHLLTGGETAPVADGAGKDHRGTASESLPVLCQKVRGYWRNSLVSMGMAIERSMWYGRGIKCDEKDHAFNAGIKSRVSPQK